MDPDAHEATQAQEAAAKVFALYTRISEVMNIPGFLTKNVPNSECRTLAQARALLSVPGNASIGYAKRQFRHDSRVVHIDKWPCTADAVTRWMAPVTFAALNAATQLVGMK